MSDPTFSIIHPNVTIGEGTEIGTHTVLGTPPMGAQPGDLELVVGKAGIIRSHSVIYAGNRIGDGFQGGHHLFIREENEIGDNVSIGTLCVIEHHVKIGDNTRLHSQVFVPEYTVIEEDCFIGPNVVFTNAPYPKAKRTKEFLRGATVCKGAKIGANASVLPGVTIGEGALVGAGSVVTKDVPPFSVVAGNPARHMKSVFDLRFPDGDQVYPEES